MNIKVLVNFNHDKQFSDYEKMCPRSSHALVNSSWTFISLLYYLNKRNSSYPKFFSLQIFSQNYGQVCRLHGGGGAHADGGLCGGCA